MAENFERLFAQMSPTDIGIWQRTMQGAGRGDEAASALGARGNQRDAIAQAMMAQQQQPQQQLSYGDGGGGGYGGGNPFAGQGWWSTFVQNVGPEAAMQWVAQQNMGSGPGGGGEGFGGGPSGGFSGGYGPSVGNPSVGNPSVGNPSVGNPSVGNPSVGNNNAPQGPVSVTFSGFSPTSAFDSAFSGFAPAFGNPAVSVSNTTTGFDAMTSPEGPNAENPGIGDEGDDGGDGGDAW